MRLSTDSLVFPIPNFHRRNITLLSSHVAMLLCQIAHRHSLLRPGIPRGNPAPRDRGVDLLQRRNALLLGSSEPHSNSMIPGDVSGKYRRDIR